MTFDALNRGALWRSDEETVPAPLTSVPVVTRTPEALALLSDLADTL
ncbi:MAG TPA: hypothetical protein PKE40_00250 [Arachnia sp.]|nr:hypothetical protein [Arachnia sp.]HMT84755.1 hypothetical protein [Arachnia sp.]